MGRKKGLSHIIINAFQGAQGSLQGTSLLFYSHYPWLSEFEPQFLHSPLQHGVGSWMSSKGDMLMCVGWSHIVTWGFWLVIVLSPFSSSAVMIASRPWTYRCHSALHRCRNGASFLPGHGSVLCHGTVCFLGYLSVSVGLSQWGRWNASWYNAFLLFPCVAYWWGGGGVALSAGVLTLLAVLLLFQKGCCKRWACPHEWVCVIMLYLVSIIVLIFWLIMTLLIVPVHCDLSFPLMKSEEAIDHRQHDQRDNENAQDSFLTISLSNYRSIEGEIT